MYVCMCVLVCVDEEQEGNKTEQNEMKKKSMNRPHTPNSNFQFCTYVFHPDWESFLRL